MILSGNQAKDINLDIIDFLKSLGIKHSYTEINHGKTYEVYTSLIFPRGICNPELQNAWGELKIYICGDLKDYSRVELDRFRKDGFLRMVFWENFDTWNVNSLFKILNQIQKRYNKNLEWDFWVYNMVSPW